MFELTDLGHAVKDKVVARLSNSILNALKHFYEEVVRKEWNDRADCIRPFPCEALSKCMRLVVQSARHAEHFLPCFFCNRRMVVQNARDCSDTDFGFPGNIIDGNGHLIDSEVKRGVKRGLWKGFQKLSKFSFIVKHFFVKMRMLRRRETHATRATSVESLRYLDEIAHQSVQYHEKRLHYKL